MENLNKEIQEYNDFLFQQVLSQKNKSWERNQSDSKDIVGVSPENKKDLRETVELSNSVNLNNSSKNFKIDENTKLQNHDLWKKRYSQNPYFFDRVSKEDDNMLQEHLHNLKKKEGKNFIYILNFFNNYQNYFTIF